MDDKLTNEQTSRREAALGLLAMLGSGALVGCASSDGAPTPAPAMVRDTASLLTGTTVIWVDSIGTKGSPLELRVPIAGGFAAGTIAIAQGFWSPGDGGGGIFFWDANTGTDDGGIFIVPGTATTGPGWRRISVEMINVKWFGARGDASTADDAAISAALQVATGGGDTVYFPKGRYKIESTIGPLPQGVTLRGSGAGIGIAGSPNSGAVIEFHGASGDAIEVSHFVNFNWAIGTKIQDLGFRRMNAANKSGAAVSAMGGAKVTISRCVFDFWMYGIVWDGAEQTLVEDCYFIGTNWAAATAVGDGPSFGIWFVDGPSRGNGMTAGDATNVHRVSRCDFNAPTVGMWVEGNASIIIDNTLVNLSGPDSCFARISRAVNLTFESCYSEGLGEAHFLFKYPTPTTSSMVTIRNHLASGQCPFIKFDGAVVYNLTLESNYLACQAISNSSAIAGAHISIGNTYAGSGRMYDSDTSMEAGFVSNIELGTGGERYVGGTAARPIAGFDHILKDYTRPGFMLRTGYGDHSVLSHRLLDRTDGTANPAYGRNVLERQTMSHLTGTTKTGVVDTHEHGFTDLAGATLAAIEIPQRVMGFVEARVTVVQASDESKGGSWILRQRFLRLYGGNVALLGTLDVTTIGTADPGWASPILVADTSAQRIAVACAPSATAGVGYWFARTTCERVSP